ncbi:LysR family transcriptional regulator [Phenylobacterium sp.]|uniref:LysR family transcriptional regulator n=1 Tax=Phenylobacterium sp. TaxID=1871053 RepID=UPI001203EDFA|nr:LysR family transcriptional regulator [Phenylobacterium sp.]THD62569.1 MAG: LysR family transcriptional regulator [Phenylobacterium sp.]
MSKLPDFEGLAIFAKVLQMQSFARAAAELQLSKATVSKAVSRLEAKFGARLFNRTSRRLSLTEAGKQLAERAAHILSEGEAAEAEGIANAASPRGHIRLAAPMSFGVLRIAPILPEFLERYPEVSIDLHLSDAHVDLIGEGYDAAIRIASLPDSSLLARTLAPVPRYLVAAPSYLARHGRPSHPLRLTEHRCIGYASTVGDTWHFSHGQGDTATVRPTGPLRVNNGDAMMPLLVAGSGLGILPDFIIRDALDDGQLEIVLPDWKVSGGAVHWVTPPGGRRPKRVDALSDFVAEKLSSRRSRAPAGT